MNAPSRIAPAAAWERYLPAVAAFCPGATDEEARHRAGLMLLRDIAADRQRHASDHAAIVFSTIESIAGRSALAALTAEQLDATRMALVRLGTGARELEKVFGEHGGG